LNSKQVLSKILAKQVLSKKFTLYIEIVVIPCSLKLSFAWQLQGAGDSARRLVQVR
jgi:hypothetical protein